MTTESISAADKYDLLVSCIRSSLVYCLISSLIVVISGIGSNSLDLKYKRSSNKLRMCKKELFITSIPNSQICCDENFHQYDWVCVASFNELNRVFSSLWAIVIPMLPLFTSMIFDLIWYIRNYYGTRPAGFAIIRSSRSSNDLVKTFKKYIPRIATYATIVIIRMVRVSYQVI